MHLRFLLLLQACTFDLSTDHYDEVSCVDCSIPLNLEAALALDGQDGQTLSQGRSSSPHAANGGTREVRNRRPPPPNFSSAPTVMGEIQTDKDIHAWMLTQFNCGGQLGDACIDVPLPLNPRPVAAPTAGE